VHCDAWPCRNKVDSIAAVLRPAAIYPHHTAQAAGCRWALVSASLQWATATSAAVPQVTCVTVSPYAGRTLEAAPRLLAGSLDGHVKIYELDTFKVLVAE
jgi:hypothetical protein